MIGRFNIIIIKEKLSIKNWKDYDIYIYKSNNIFII
jgi:hypothetical protein